MIIHKYLIAYEDRVSSISWRHDGNPQVDRSTSLRMNSRISCDPQLSWELTRKLHVLFVVLLLNRIGSGIQRSFLFFLAFGCAESIESSL